MKLRNLQRPPPLDFLNISDLQLICVSGEKKNWNSYKGVSLCMETKLNCGVWVYVLCF